MLLPEIILAVSGLFFFSNSIFELKLNHRGVAIAFAALAVVGAIVTLDTTGLFFHGVYQADRFSRFFALLITVAYLLACIVADRMSGTDSKKINEFFFFLSICTLGLIMVVSSMELITMFIALEIASFPLYITASYRRNLGFQFEAVAKYMIFGAISTGIMLYGISYIFGAFGTTHLNRIFIELPSHLHDPMAVLGVVLFMAGLAYKLSAFPFHFWAPDVYSGAAAEVVAFIASLPKLAAVALFVRVIAGFLDFEALTIVIAVMAVLSMTVGNLMALNQVELKRLIAYSAVSHAGYVLLGLLAPDHGGLSAAIFYGAVYMMMTLAAFLLAVQVAGEDHDISIDRLSGLWQRSPILAVMLAVVFISMAGLPPTAGFTGKLLLITSAWKAGHFWPVLAAVLNTLIGFYYYLKIIKISLVDEQQGGVTLKPSLLITTTAVVLGLVLILLGILPGSLLEMADSAVQSVFT